MAELLIEVLGEEIPARMQEAAENRFREAVLGGLRDAGLAGAGMAARSWSGPRRLAVSVGDVLERQPDATEEKRGPRADAPEQAIEGFLKSVGIKRNKAETRSTPKGDFLFATIEQKGKPASEVLPGVVAGVLADFTWPKTMRWHRSSHGWIRPLHRIVATLDGKAVKGAFDLGGGVVIAFGKETAGHSMLAPEPFAVSGAQDYEKGLEKRFVVADRVRRTGMITEQLGALASKRGLVLKEDPGLLAEVAGLVEYPNTVVGGIDDEFMELPEEILVTAMRSHQKYFAFRDKKGALAPVFATVSNMAPDKTRDANIVAGNERVLRARLADAKFFWDQDKSEGLGSMASRLGSIQFFENLGTMADKSRNVAKLSSSIARKLHDAALLKTIDEAHVERASNLAKADLVSSTVDEFPELQGVIGGYLADEEYSSAIRDHYRPEGPEDSIPETGLGRVVALADKLDTLVGFFGIDLVPTGSKDPHALRRAALGVIRIIVESEMVLPLSPVIEAAASRHGFDAPPEALMGFIHDRLKVWLRERGIRHDVIAAIVRPGEVRADDLLHLFRMTEALMGLLDTEDGKGLLAGYTRTVSILAAEEKKDGLRYEGIVNKRFLKAEEAITLLGAVDELARPIESTDDAIGRMRMLGGLRAPIDAFFEAVVVNDDDAAIRTNRLNLLGKIRVVMEEIADFSAIEG